MQGSWHGKDAFRYAGKISLSILGISVAYLILSMVLSFNSLWASILVCVALVALAGAYMYSRGLWDGQNDAAFGEIMYAREAEGKEVPAADRERCYHPAKGLFAVLVGALVFVLIALVFAFMTKPIEYSLGTLPSWLEGLKRQNEMGDALSYYNDHAGLAAMDIFRIGVRAMVMPFINMALKLGGQAILWVERLSPVLLLLAPMGYAIGYKGGLKARIRVNTGIAIGVAQKKRQARKEQKRRAQSKSPERLI